MKKIILFCYCLVLLLSCSKNDEAPIDNPVGGDAYRFQVITIDLPNTTLNENEYHGSMGSIEITLNKNDEHQLLFMVPGSIPLGSQDLIINDLNNLKVSYNIKLPILPDTPDNTIAPMQANIDALTQTLDLTDTNNQNILQASNSFNDLYANASEADKTTIATVYHVNKAIIDDLILNDYSTVTGRYDQNADLLLYKFKLSLLAMGSGVFLAQFGAEGIEKATGILLVIIGFGKAVKFYKDFVVIKINSLNIEFDAVLGINDRNSMFSTNAILNLPDNTATTVAFKTVDRTIISSDNNKTEQGTASFFKSFTKINGFSTTLNPIITWVNNNVPYANFSLLPVQTLATTSPTVSTPVDAGTFQKITFNISDPVASLLNASLTNTGQLQVKVKANGTPTFPVSTFINYNFSDNFSSFSGKIPIKIYADNYPKVTIGNQTWMLKNLDVTTYRNGDPIPQVTDPIQWANLTTGAWCYFNNDPAYGAVYGKMYNWYAVNDPRGLAPLGYHIPTDNEWATLVSFCGGMQEAGTPLKEAGNAHWINCNINYTGATNATGFTGLPGGQRNLGVFQNAGYYGVFWTTTTTYTLDCGGGYINYDNNPNVILGNYVRCLKD
jgi:uncharacterized protein (TIGR02145 family)